MVITTNSLGLPTGWTTSSSVAGLQQAIAELHTAQHASDVATAELVRANDTLTLVEEADRAARARVREASIALDLAVYEADL